MKDKKRKTKKRVGKGKRLEKRQRWNEVYERARGRMEEGGEGVAREERKKGE